MLTLAVPMVAAGCADVTPPTAARVGSPVPAATGAASRAEAVLVGTYSAPNAVPLPGGQITSYVVPAHSGITVKPNSYVLLRISGTLRAEHNPYRLGSTPGQIVATYTPVEAREGTGRGNTVVWLRRSGGKAPPEGGELISYYFRPDNAERDVMLMVAGGAQPVEVWAGREMMPGSQRQYFYCALGFPYCQGSGVGVVLPDTTYKPSVWIEDYWVVESHVLTGTEVPEPLVVEGPDMVAPGAAATFNARPWGDLRLRDRNGTPGDVRWLWYPNDTTGTPPPGSSPRPVCLGASCEYKPTESGRLHVYSFVEGALVEANRIVRVQQQRVQLTCPASVQRGSTMNCNVTAVPGGTLDSVRWTFVDTAGNTVRDSLRLSWDGRMVVGGRMSVSARLNGQIVSADTSIAVQPRTWVSPVPAIRHGTQGCATLTDTCLLLYPPVSYGDMGSTVSTPRGFTLHDRAATISTGPNTGWSWITGNTSPFQYTEKVILVNRVLSPNDTSQVATTFWNNNPQCNRAAMLQDVIAHETHHVHLYIRNSAVLNAEAERTLAFGVSAAEWRTRLAPGGTEARRLASRQEELSGSMHRQTDGFPAQSCTLNLLP